MTWLRRIGLAAIAVVVVGACAADGPQDSGSPSLGVSVTGFLVVEAGRPVRLCEALTESSPPQCAGESTMVVGLELSEINELESADSVHWTAAPITLLGERDGDVLTVPVESDRPSIVGRAVAGPVCPVETNPPDPRCAARSVPDAAVVIRAHDGNVVATVVTDATGRFAVAVTAGDFTVEPDAVDGLLGQASPVPVTVATGPASVELAYDTGIR